MSDHEKELSSPPSGLSDASLHEAKRLAGLTDEVEDAGHQQSLLQRRAALVLLKADFTLTQIGVLLDLSESQVIEGLRS